MKVQNTINAKGNKVVNQFIITDAIIIPNCSYGLQPLPKTGTMFQSYDSNIVFKAYDGQIYLDKYKWDYSRTTGKYRNQFLDETKKETQKKIDSGEYLLMNLNK